MDGLNEQQALGATIYGITVIPASIAAAGFLPIGVPVLVWLAIAGIGGVLGGAVFWEKRWLAGGFFFGIAGALSPFAVAAYVESQMANVSPWAMEVEFNVLGLIAPPALLLIVAFIAVVIAGLVSKAGRSAMARQA